MPITTKYPIILASASPARLNLMKNIGLIPDNVMPMDIDETELAKELPKNVALRLAHQKALAAAESVSEAIIIAADTVSCVGRKILPKALDNAMVEACLRAMSGRRHKVYTGLSIILKTSNHPQKQITKVVESIVKYKKLTEEEIKLYLNSQEGIGKSGGCTINGLSQIFVSWMSGSNSNIAGLPLHEMYLIFKGLGLNIEEFIKRK